MTTAAIGYLYTATQEPKQIKRHSVHYLHADIQGCCLLAHNISSRNCWSSGFHFMALQEFPGLWMLIDEPCYHRVAEVDQKVISSVQSVDQFCTL